MSRYIVNQAARDMAHRLLTDYPEAATLMLNPAAACRSYCSTSNTLETLQLWDDDGTYTDFGYDVRDALHVYKSAEDADVDFRK